MATVARITPGLVFHDTFDRPNSPTVGNGWAESGGITSINTNRLELGNSTNREQVSQAFSFPTDYITEGRLAGGQNFTTNLFAESDGLLAGVFDGISCFIDPAGNQVSIRRQDTGVIAWTVSTALVHGVSDRVKARLVGERSLPTVQYRGYFDLDNTPGPTFPDIGVDPTTTILRNDADKANGSALISGRGGEDDYYWLCGRNVVVNGLGSGWRVVLIPHSTAIPNTNYGPFTESGGSVTINVDAKALPFNTVQIQNSGGGVEASLTPGGALPDVWGGDVYQVSGVEPAGAAVAAARPVEYIGGDLVVERTISFGSPAQEQRRARIISGIGDPEGSMDAPEGSAFFRTDGPPWVYIKESGGGGATGWVAEIP